MFPLGGGRGVFFIALRIFFFFLFLDFDFFFFTILTHCNRSRKNFDTFISLWASIWGQSQSNVSSLMAPRETDALLIRVSIIRMSNVVEYAGARSRSGRENGGTII